MSLERRNDWNARNYDRQQMSLLGGRRTFGSNHSSYPSTFSRERLVSILQAGIAAYGPNGPRGRNPMRS
jgi:hypothetical protein